MDRSENFALQEYRYSIGSTSRQVSKHARDNVRIPYRESRGILKTLVKILVALAVSAIALGAFEEGLVPHLVACVSSCYMVHFISHGWALVKGRTHHHDGC